MCKVFWVVDSCRQLSAAAQRSSNSKLSEVEFPILEQRVTKWVVHSMNSRVLHFPHGSFLKQGSQYYVVLLIDKRMYSTGVFVHPSRGGWRPQFSTTRNNDAIDHTARTFDGVFSSTVTNPYSSAPIDTFLRHNIEVGKGTSFDRQTLLQTRNEIGDSKSTGYRVHFVTVNCVDKSVI